MPGMALMPKTTHRPTVKSLIKRAILLDPDNLNMRYNLACALVVDLHDIRAALNLFGPLFEKINAELMNRAKTDPDLDSMRDDSRFKDMIAAAEARLAAVNETGSAPKQ